MSKSQVIAILFDGNSENLIFYAGQLVTGHVHVETTERLKIRGVRLQVTGVAETSWEEGNDEDETTYTGREEYMDLEISLIGSRSHDSEMYLEPSVNKYPFSFILPEELPQTFDDNIGHIRYKAKAVIDRPMRFDDEAEIQFTVIRLLDLNKEPPQLREPLVIHNEEPASGCFCIDGVTEINATVNRGCFVPGETMRVEGAIANHTNSTIKRSTIALFQTIEYSDTGKNQTTHATKTLAKFERPPIGSGHTDSWNNILFVVPQVLSSRLDGCSIIDIKYFVEISATFHECCSKSTASSEIVIGNIPLRDNVQASVVTAQPMGFPMPYDTSVGYMPPAYTPNLEYDPAAAEVGAWNHDDKQFPEVHKS